LQSVVMILELDMLSDRVIPWHHLMSIGLILLS